MSQRGFPIHHSPGSNVVDGQPKASAVRHCIAGINCQIQDYLFDLARVYVNDSDIRLHVGEVRRLRR